MRSCPRLVLELPLDAVAAWSVDKRELTLAVVNPTREERALGLDLRGARLLGPTRRYVITAADPRAHNAPGEPRAVDIQETSLDQAPPALRAPGLSVSLYVLQANADARP